MKVMTHIVTFDCAPVCLSMQKVAKYNTKATSECADKKLKLHFTKTSPKTY